MKAPRLDPSIIVPLEQVTRESILRRWATASSEIPPNQPLHLAGAASGRFRAYGLPVALAGEPCRSPAETR